MLHLRINPFEAKALRALSSAYVEVDAMKRKKQKPDMSEFAVAQELAPVMIPQGMSGVMQMNEIEALKDFFRRQGKREVVKPTKQKAKAKTNGPRDDRTEG